MHSRAGCGFVDTGFAHRWLPPEGSSRATILALHGTGGDENDLLPLARAVAPGAGVLSPRGKVLEHGMPRFFRRLAEGVFDEEDVMRRAHELADFVASAARERGFDPARVYALGYSNGANIAAAMLLLRPEALAGGVILRAMPPLVAPPPAKLAGKEILLALGERDPIIPRFAGDALAVALRANGAKVDVHLEPGGHELRPGDIAAAKAWLAARLD